MEKNIPLTDEMIALEIGCCVGILSDYPHNNYKMQMVATDMMKTL
jgi:cyclopropane fatty-acyl-phospholipid synthase-like methyltransferase